MYPSMYAPVIHLSVSLSIYIIRNMKKAHKRRRKPEARRTNWTFLLAENLFMTSTRQDHEWNPDGGDHNTTELQWWGDRGQGRSSARTPDAGGCR